MLPLKRLLISATAALACLATFTTLCSAAPPSETDLITDSGWTLQTSHAGDAALTTVSGDAPNGRDRNILRVQVSTPAPLIYNIQLTQLLNAPIPADHLLRYSFWARSTDAHILRAVIEQDKPPFPRLLGSDSIALTPKWQDYSFTANCTGAPAGSLGARLQVGLQAGTVEFADVQAQDLGLDPAVTRDQAALAPAAIQARIRKYRMADLTVRIVGPSGRPLPNVKIAVFQQRHAFLFGCNIFGLSDINAASSAPSEWKLQQAYRQAFAGLFNYATLPFYWGAFEPQPGQPNFPRLTWMAKWCRQHGIQTKAHPLVWQQVYPSWAPNAPDHAIPLLHKRIDSIVDTMSGLTNYYDVINETMAAPTYSPANGESLWVERDGAPRVTETVLGWARNAARAKGAASDRFIVNDYLVDDNYAALFRQLQSRGSLPDAIGIQSHMHTGVWPMRQVWDTCERFAPFGLPIHFTETTVLSSLTPHALDYNGPPAIDWLSTPDGEAAQADYVAQFYTVLFSHPQVRAITWWDLSDRDAWLGAPGGLLRRDMTHKAAYDRLNALIKHAWWTNATGTSNSAGRYTIRAFYGGYAIHVTDGRGRTTTVQATMPEASGPKTITIRMP